MTSHELASPTNQSAVCAKSTKPDHTNLTYPTRCCAKRLGNLAAAKILDGRWAIRLLAVKHDLKPAVLEVLAGMMGVYKMASSRVGYCW
jgi:hypothetical protein